jgi:hypothetical protein
MRVLNPPPHYSSLIPLHRLPHYLSPFFLSFLLTAYGDGRKTEVMRWMIILQERKKR